MKYLSLLVFCIFLLSCDNTFEIKNHSLGSNGDLGQCKVNLQATLDSKNKIPRDPFYKSKILFSDFIFENTQLLSKAKDIILNKDKKLAIQVDRKCLSSQLPKTKLTQHLSPKRSVGPKVETHALTLSESISLSALSLLAQQDPCVLGISNNIEMQLYARPNDTYYNKQSHLGLINHDVEYDYFFSNGGIQSDSTIAIIDDGVDINHSDLQQHIWVNVSELNGIEGVDDDNNGYVDDVHGYDFILDVADPKHKTSSTHGTHVAGLAAAVGNNSNGVSGVMSHHAKIMALNVFGNSTAVSTPSIDEAIRYAADNGANVINMSLGGRGRSSTTASAIQYAVNKGVTVVVAAGNDGVRLTSSVWYTPASYGAEINGMMTVGASDAASAKAGQRCSFSNYSTTYVDFGAPGCDTSVNGIGILSTVKGDQYNTLPGTSMSSPVAAGAALVAFSMVRDVSGELLSPSQIENLMKAGAEKSSQLETFFRDGNHLNLSVLASAVEDLINHKPPPPSHCP